MKDTDKVLYILIGMLFPSFIIILMAIYLFGIDLDIINSVIMMATLLTAIISIFVQTRKKPNIIINPTPISIDNQFYIVVANLGNKMAEKIEIKGNIARQNYIMFLAPNEKVYININDRSTANRYNCTETKQEKLPNNGTHLVSSEPYMPNIGISSSGDTIYICRNSSKKEYDTKNVTWLYNAKEAVWK